VLSTGGETLGKKSSVAHQSNQGDSKGAGRSGLICGSTKSKQTLCKEKQNLKPKMGGGAEALPPQRQAVFKARGGKKKVTKKELFRLRQASR